MHYWSRYCCLAKKCQPAVSILCFLRLFALAGWCWGFGALWYFLPGGGGGLILFEQWAGHRLLSEKVTRPHERAYRPISISSVLVSEALHQQPGQSME